MRWSSDFARGSGGRSGSNDAEVVRVGAAAAAPAPAALADGLACGGEEVGFTGAGFGGSDGDEAVIPSRAGDGTCDCIIVSAAAADPTRGREARMLAQAIKRELQLAASSHKSFRRETSSSPPPLPAQSKPAMDGGSSSPAAAAADAMEMEEYQNWKKNAPVLYDLIISHPLEWPSLTVQWLPSQSPASARSHRLLLGTHASDESPNHLMLADAVLPLPPRLAAAIAADGGALPAPSVSICRSVPHRGEVNRARCMPQRPYTVATKTCVDEVHVYHLGNGGEKRGADVVLRGHDAEGYGLAWSPMKEGWLLSGSYDKKICLWDLAAGSGAPVLDAQQLFEAHEDVVEDVAWHPKDDNLFGSVGDDCKLMMWDLRTNKPEQSIAAHQKEVNSLSFNPFNEWILATASGDGTIKLFDVRKLSRSLHAFDNHEGEVFQVEWNPNLEAVLASYAADKRVMIWDVSRIGDEQAEEDANDGPPELLFVHGGHTAKISELSWNPSEKWVIASVAEDNILQIWEMAENIYCDDNFLHNDDDSRLST